MEFFADETCTQHSGSRESTVRKNPALSPSYSPFKREQCIPGVAEFAVTFLTRSDIPGVLMSDELQKIMNGRVNSITRSVLSLRADDAGGVEDFMSANIQVGGAAA